MNPLLLDPTQIEFSNPIGRPRNLAITPEVQEMFLIPEFKALVDSTYKGSKIPPPTSVAWQNRALEVAYELNRQAMAQSARHFIENYVYIENKSGFGDRVIKFRLWPAQEQVLQDFLIHRLVAAVKSRQLGLTWLALAYAVWRMLFIRGFTTIAVSRTDADAIELIDHRLRLFIMANLPSWLVQHKKMAHKAWRGPVWDSTQHELTIYHPPRKVQGRLLPAAESRFIARPATEGAGRSLTADLLILDEWAYQQFDREIWTAAYPSINRPGATVESGQVIGISSGKAGTLFEEVARNAPSNGFKLIFLPWTADPNRDAEWYEQARKALPTTYQREYPETLDDAFSAGEDMAFPYFVKEPGGGNVCLPFKIPRWWPRWRSNDIGVGDPYAWYCFALAPDGRIFVYREYARALDSQERPTYSEQARTFAEMCIVGSEIGQPEYEGGAPVYERFEFTAVGHDAYRTNPETGKRIVDYYIDNGIDDVIQAPADRIGRMAAVAEALAIDHQARREPAEDIPGYVGEFTSRVVIFSTCKHLINSIPQLVSDPNEPNRVKNSNIDHYYDALGYGLQAWSPERVRPPQPPKTMIQKHKERIARQRGRYGRLRIVS